MTRFLCVFVWSVCLLAQQQDRPVPPPGVPVSDSDRALLQNGLLQLSDSLAKLKDHKLAPDVTIFREAVRFALTYNEFFKPEDIEKAKTLLRQGQERADALLRGEAPWTSQTGLVVRGYVSKIDGSVQPYGLVIPETWSPKAPQRWRLDTWFHGRSETLSEVNFLYERQTRAGEFTPPNAIVLHLYGRYCNANKFAGEVDLFEALDDVKKRYSIDENRIVVRGFSMGGAATWHIAAHHAGLWAAAAPGAGFSESAEFLRLKEKPPVWEQALWRMYDATESALNFFNLPLVAYSGEIDGQKQAADIMQRFFDPLGIKMTHVIGPKTGHRYHPDAKVEINRRIDAIADLGRNPYPRTIKFTTFTTRYNRMKWVVVDELEKHWERASVHAAISNDHTVRITSQNVRSLTLDFGPGGCPLAPDNPVTIVWNGKEQKVAPPMSDRSWKVQLGGLRAGLRKKHGLQGPIDDAFMDSFIFVTPTAEPAHKDTAERIAGEQSRAIREWRRQFRGDARVKKDTEITDADIASANLVLWGDPGSNRLMAKIASQLPLKWEPNAYPVMIYPNPLNPERYVVINSGFTFREYDYLNNARQISKLPDYAWIDVTQPADGRYPGKVRNAGFFDESWK